MEGDTGFLKEGVRALSRAIKETEVEEDVGAARHERSPGPRGERKTATAREWLGHTRVGTVELSVPRVKDSS
jgi:transposase-like protein